MTSPRPPPSSGGRPANAGILIDALHFFRSHSSLDELAALPATWFHFVQLCDAPATVPSSVDGVIHVARSARSLPGYGGLPLPDLLDLLPAGPYSLEVPNDVLRRELGTAEFARLVLTLARAIVASHGQPPWLDDALDHHPSHSS